MTDREILEKLLSKVENLESGQKSLESGQKSLESGQEELRTRTRRLEVLLENELPKQIKIIAEQHGDIIKRLDKLTDYPDTKSRVATLETVVKSHSEDIRALEKAVG